MYRASMTLILAIVFPVQQQNAPASEPVPAPYDVKDAYEIYSLLIPHNWIVTEAHAQSLLIQAETQSYPICLNPANEEERSVVGPAIHDFVEANKKKWLLQRMFEVEQPYELLRSEEIKASFRGDSIASRWKAFYARYPQSRGWIELSAVGFNADKTIAVVYVGHHCGSLCGGGGFTVLERNGGKWAIRRFKGTSCAWAS
jgi:hypothetical protein